MENKQICIYEALGAFCINFFFFSMVAVNNQLQMFSFFQLALIPAVSYYVIYQLFQHKCRGHFNPALTFSSYITAECSLKEFLAVCAAQLGGTAAAAIGAVVLFSNNNLKLELTVRTIDFQFTDIPRLQITLILLFLTSFGLGITYFYSFSPKQNKKPLPFCLALFLVNLINLPVTGTGIHPLRLFIQVIFKKNGGEYPLYMFIVFLGTVCGALLYYKFLHRKQKSIHHN